MGFLWCRRINSLCGEFYNKIKKDADADAVQQPNLRRSRVGVPVSLFFFCFFFLLCGFFSQRKKRNRFLCSVEVDVWVFAVLLSGARTLSIVLWAKLVLHTLLRAKCYRFSALIELVLKIKQHFFEQLEVKGTLNRKKKPLYLIIMFAKLLNKIWHGHLGLATP